MHISLPELLKEFVDEQVRRGYGTTSEHIRELIRRDQDGMQLRGLLPEGAASPKGKSADKQRFKRICNQVRYSANR